MTIFIALNDIFQNMKVELCPHSSGKLAVEEITYLEIPLNTTSFRKLITHHQHFRKWSVYLQQYKELDPPVLSGFLSLAHVVR